MLFPGDLEVGGPLDGPVGFTETALGVVGLAVLGFIVVDLAVVDLVVPGLAVVGLAVVGLVVVVGFIVVCFLVLEPEAAPDASASFGDGLGVFGGPHGGFG